MKNILTKIKNSYFKALKGEENFWVVLLGWGIGLYTLSIVTGFYIFKFSIFSSLVTANETLVIKLLLNFFWSIILGLTGLMGIILVFIYPIVFFISVVRCSIKYGIFYKLFAVILLIIFLFLHSFLGLFSPDSIFMISKTMIEWSFISIAAVIVITSYIAYRVFKLFITKERFLSYKKHTSYGNNYNNKLSNTFYDLMSIFFIPVPILLLVAVIGIVTTIYIGLN